jgi:hypothetical protein
MIASARPASGLLHIAVVHGTDTEPYVAVGESRLQVTQCLASHVARHAPTLLWPDDAERVARFLTSRDLEGAVNAYFEALGDHDRRVRWERQWVVYRSFRWPGTAVSRRPQEAGA